MIGTVLFGLCLILADVVGHDTLICNESQCISCRHCNPHYTCPPKTKLTCYIIAKRGGGGDKGHHIGDSNCACQPEDYCDGFYSCHNWPCPDSGFIPQCNIWNHTCICVHRTGTCSGTDVSTCKITCNSEEKLYCDHGFCSCKSLDYCNQNNADCANLSCNADQGESPFCNVTRCQCAVVVDRCQGSDTSTCRHLNCNGPFMHQICNNGNCQCQLNPSCSSAVECTETNTAMQIGTIALECKSQFSLYTDCKNGRCQCFQNTSSTTTAPSTPFSVPTTTASTTRSTTPQKQTTTITSTIPQPTTSTAPQQTTSTAPQQTTTRVGRSVVAEAEIVTIKQQIRT
ncbi:uncharacterized protein [Magallana gigas]|uniref:uncharacterized protein n=1 Tax=Magallana gigas TaxID=29159 RepID=UPI00334104E2